MGSVYRCLIQLCMVIVCQAVLSLLAFNLAFSSYVLHNRPPLIALFPILVPRECLLQTCLPLIFFPIFTPIIAFFTIYPSFTHFSLIFLSALPFHLLISCIYLCTDCAHIMFSTNTQLALQFSSVSYQKSTSH